MFFAALFYVLFFGIVVISVLVVTVISYYRYKYKRQKNEALKVAFFHPYCNSCGGGERVLWIALFSLINQYPNIEMYVYTTQVQFAPSEILHNVSRKFGVRVDPKKVDFIYLRRGKWIDSETYPFMTLLCQGLGTMWLGLEALAALQPDILIDTMGCPFVMPVFKLLTNCKIACYVHYPIITKEMMYRVQKRFTSYNNREFITRSPCVTAIKLLYYRLFGFLYYLIGKTADVIIVNSSWTEEHINSLWKRPFFTHRIFPPCPIEHLKGLPRAVVGTRILSVGQFRPEKDHPVQIQAMYQLRSMLLPAESVDDDFYDKRWKAIKLVLVGSCRNAEDDKRVQDLKDLVSHLALDDSVEFLVNISYRELLEEYTKASIGLHTMRDEHFGISVVEMLAAGLVTIANRSGGPLLDIIDTSEGNVNGILASTIDEYATAMAKVIEGLSGEEVRLISKNAQASVDRFSNAIFVKRFLDSMKSLIK